MFELKPLSKEAIPALEKAIDQRLAGNDDAVLRWNTCARMIVRNPQLVPTEEQLGEHMLE